MEPLLGVAIGLVLTFAVVAVIVSSVTELFSGCPSRPRRALEAGIARMLDDARDSRPWWKRWPPFASQTAAPATSGRPRPPADQVALDAARRRIGRLRTSTR